MIQDRAFKRLEELRASGVLSDEDFALISRNFAAAPPVESAGGASPSSSPWRFLDRFSFLLVAGNAACQVVFATIAFPIFIALWHGSFVWGDDVGGNSGYIVHALLQWWPLLWVASQLLVVPAMELIWRMLGAARARRMPVYLTTSWTLWIGFLAFGSLGD